MGHTASVDTAGWSPTRNCTARPASRRRGTRAPTSAPHGAVAGRKGSPVHRTIRVRCRMRHLVLAPAHSLGRSLTVCAPVRCASPLYDCAPLGVCVCVYHVISATHRSLRPTDGHFTHVRYRTEGWGRSCLVEYDLSYRPCTQPWARTKATKRCVWLQRRRA